MEIKQVVPEELLTSNAHELEPGQAELIGYAESTEDVSDFIKKANEAGKKVITIGAHTGLTGATYPHKDEWFLSLAKMTDIISLDKETLTLNVQAGVTLAQIREYLADTPYFYAPDPGEKSATIGGTVGTNAGGMRAIKYGVTRDNVRGYDVVLANGDIIHAGSLNQKNSSGYDLKDLFIGSEGTLGVITELQLKLTTRPRFESSMLVGFEKLEDLAPTVYEILNSPVEPVALELLEKNSVSYAEDYLQVEMPKQEGAAFLLLTLNSNDEKALNRELDEVRSIVNSAGALNIRDIDEKEAKLVWNIRDHILTGIYAAATTKMYDPVVPTRYVPDLIIQSKKYADEMEISSAFFGHAGDGNIHICVLQEDYEDLQWKEMLEEYEEKLYPLIADLDGLPSAEHGIGLEKKEYLPYFYTKEYMNTLKAIKKALDSKNVLNPNRIFDL
ncbi:FAD-binding oxidoreductase [Tetragenococcus osmophilus]|uniref:FAD-binding oxidoreductase n=2 Tax=Tetragenococcus osmophilus TaxID=526944 RepID=A0ABN5QXB9_9ENTE|nr:FAD-binding oxidoreductase [Tetragenococcus osmophilus]AYW48432.1 FAD-binding oxidoreductase [Tetragenococcus osmophilus]